MHIQLSKAEMGHLGALLHADLESTRSTWLTVTEVPVSMKRGIPGIPNLSLTSVHFVQNKASLQADSEKGSRGIHSAVSP